MTSKGSKLTAIVLVAIVVAGGLGYWLLTPKMSSPLVTYTTQQTLLLTTSQQPSVLTSSEQTQRTSTLSTTVISVSETTLWINVGATKSVNYYLALLESNRTEPYAELARELRKLPDLTNATAVAKITYLALNATNPEVKEAFELMIKGGTPDPRDFSYSVPHYNTELQVLYWLACQNDFKKDDTLSLAVAMVNGLWVTMGNEQIRQAVHNDTNALLRFGRETSDWQRGARLRYNLEDYPLEAKVAWAWTGSGSAKWGVPKPLRDYVSIRPSTEAYELNTVSPDGLSAIREYVLSKDLEKASVLDTVDSIETFAWSKLRAVSYPYEKDPQGYVFNDNADYLFHLLMTSGQFSGDCGAVKTVTEAFAKALGISSLVTWQYMHPTKFHEWYAHGHNIYFDPPAQKWVASKFESSIESHVGHYVTGFPPVSDDTKFQDIIIVPPVRQRGYTRDWPTREWTSPDDTHGVDLDANYCHLFTDIELRELMGLFQDGIPSSRMKTWLLYEAK